MALKTCVFCQFGMFNVSNAAASMNLQQSKDSTRAVKSDLLHRMFSNKADFSLFKPILSTKRKGLELICLGLVQNVHSLINQSQLRTSFLSLQ